MPGIAGAKRRHASAPFCLMSFHASDPVCSPPPIVILRPQPKNPPAKPNARHRHAQSSTIATERTQLEVAHFCLQDAYKE